MINKNNVEELWELYEEYKTKFYNRYYSDVKCDDFETYIENNVVQCKNCDRYVLEEDMGTSELALADCVCKECMQDGYGS